MDVLRVPVEADLQKVIFRVQHLRIAATWALAASSQCGPTAAKSITRARSTATTSRKAPSTAKAKRFCATTRAAGRCSSGGLAHPTRRCRVWLEKYGAPAALNREAAIIATLPPGNYTGVMNGVGGSTGVGPVEVYNLPQKARLNRRERSSRRPPARWYVASALARLG
jgi:hypothetical protein